MLHSIHLYIVQTPSGTPNPGRSSPLDFSDPFEVIVFVILPLLIFIAYFIWRKKEKNK